MMFCKPFSTLLFMQDRAGCGNTGVSPVAGGGDHQFCPLRSVGNVPDVEPQLTGLYVLRFFACFYINLPQNDAI